MRVREPVSSSGGTIAWNARSHPPSPVPGGTATVAVLALIVLGVVNGAVPLTRIVMVSPTIRLTRRAAPS